MQVNTENESLVPQRCESSAHHATCGDPLMSEQREGAFRHSAARIYSALTIGLWI